MKPFRESKVCPWWLAYTFDNPLRRWMHDPQSILGSFVREGMIVGDIGCGMGYFTVPLAKLVGEKGTVFAVDVQQQMLDRMLKRAEKAGVAARIRPLRTNENDIGIKDPVDFLRAFWMVHETPDIPAFFTQVRSILKEGGKLLFAEPRMHVSVRAFRETLDHARQAGLAVSEGPRIRMSRAVIVSKK